MAKPFISCVILAAGESTRFPGGKLVQIVKSDRGEKPLIRYLTDKYLGFDVIDEVVIVVGYNFADVIIATSGSMVKYVYNPDYRKGMSYSVKRGVASVLKYSDIVVVHPGDVPFIREESIAILLGKAITLHGNGKDFIILPRYRGKGGHPLVVSKNLAKHILEITEEERGLKGFLRRYAGYKVYVDVDDFGVVYDVDEPEDLVKAEDIFGIKWVK